MATQPEKQNMVLTLEPTEEEMVEARQGIMDQLGGLAMGFVTAGATIAVGALVLSEIKSDPDVTADANATQAVNDSLESISTLTGKFSLIALVTVLSIVLALVVGFKAFNR